MHSYSVTIKVEWYECCAHLTIRTHAFLLKSEYLLKNSNLFICVCKDNWCKRSTCQALYWITHNRRAWKFFQHLHMKILKKSISSLKGLKLWVVKGIINIPARLKTWNGANLRQWWDMSRLTHGSREDLRLRAAEALRKWARTALTFDWLIMFQSGVCRCGVKG